MTEFQLRMYVCRNIKEKVHTVNEINFSPSLLPLFTPHPPTEGHATVFMCIFEIWYERFL